VAKHKFYRRHKRKKYPTVAAVLSLHEEAIKVGGGTRGLRGNGVSLLESALDKPFQTVGGQDAYPGFFEKVAATGFFIVNLHPFVDGNKRAALQVMMYTLGINGHKCKPCTQFAVATVVLIATNHLEIPGVAASLRLWCGLDPV